MGSINVIKPLLVAALSTTAVDLQRQRQESNPGPLGLMGEMRFFVLLISELGTKQPEIEELG